MQSKKSIIETIVKLMINCSLEGEIQDEKRTERETWIFAAIDIRQDYTAGSVCDFDCYWFHFEPRWTYK